MDESNKDIHINKSKMYIDEYGNKEYINLKAEYHRLDGPAIERINGAKAWYKEGKCHRENGPACECSNGDKVWYKKGRLHRIDGPAIEYANGDKSWFVFHKKLEEKEFNSWISRIKKCI